MAYRRATVTCKSLSKVVPIFCIFSSIFWNSVTTGFQDDISNLTSNRSSSSGIGRVLQPTEQLHEVAGLEMEVMSLKGIRARIPMWNPKLGDELSERSSTVMSAASATSEIQVGWEVNPKRHGDTNPHLFVYTRNATHSWYDEQDGYCFELWNNLAVSGKAFTFELEWTPRGRVTLMINSAKFGIWPEGCVPGLEEGTTSVFWGGQVSYDRFKLTTVAEMGNGVRPNATLASYGGAAFIQNIQWKKADKRGYKTPEIRGKLQPLFRPAAKDDAYTAYGCPPRRELPPPGFPRPGYVVYYGGPLEKVSP